jgi:hypothetical protein
MMRREDLRRCSTAMAMSGDPQVRCGPQEIDKRRSMKNQVEDALRVLTGKILWGAGRAGEIAWFQFGNKETIITERETIKEVGEYALHVQCARRITSSQGIFVGSQDMHYPAGEPYQKLEDFDWDQPGANRCDERISLLFSKQEAFLVEGVSADSFGGFCLILSDGFSLETFPDDSLDDEFWRLFQPYKDTQHFIVTGCGIEKQ